MRDFWASRWTAGQLGWHQSKITPSLERFVGRLSQNPATDDQHVGRVFVPLCGKSMDLSFLAERANAVVGVEFVEQAVQEFFSELGQEPSVETDPLPRYSADNITLFAADYFDLRPEITGEIDAVFDRASLVALDAPTRKRYAAHMATLLNPGARVLLVTFDYDQSEMNGPPFAVSHVEVDELYSANFGIEHLATRDVLNDDMARRGLTAMTESTWLLIRKDL